MPPHENSALKRAQKYVEYSIFAYQLYAGLLQSRSDPYLLGLPDRKTAQEILKEQATFDPHKPIKHLDYTSYVDIRQFDPRHPVFYRDELNMAQFYAPTEFTQRIGKVIHGEDIVEYPKSGAKDSIDIYVFEGETGITGNAPGVHSPLGCVAYDRASKEITVAFRGSRSGGNMTAIVREAMFYESGSPDWVTDLQTNALEPFEKISEDGKFQPGFARTYLSCRMALVGIIVKIQQSDPTAEQTLVTTGHSLGGSLATVMFIDAKIGLLKVELQQRISDERYTKKLLEEAQCVTVSALGVCNEDVIGKLGQSDRGRFTRVYYENDPIIAIARQLGGTKKIVAKYIMKIEKPIEFIPVDETNDINLGSFGTATYDSRAHELPLVHKTIQQLQGVPPEVIKRYWMKVNSQLKIMDITPADQHLTKLEAAKIIRQFNIEYFLTLATLSAEKQGTSSEEIKKIQKLIELIGNMFHDESMDPYKTEKQFNLFRLRLYKIVTALKGSSGSDSNLVIIKIAKIVNPHKYSLKAIQKLSSTIEKIIEDVAKAHESSSKIPDEIKELTTIYTTKITELIDSFRLVRSLDPESDGYQPAFEEIENGLKSFKEFLAEEQEKRKGLSKTASTILGATTKLTETIRIFIVDYQSLLKAQKLAATPEHLTDNIPATAASEIMINEFFLTMLSQLNDGLKAFDDALLIATMTQEPSSFGSRLTQAYSAATTFVETAGTLSRAFSEYAGSVATSAKPSPQQYVYATLHQLLQIYDQTDFEAMRLSKSSEEQETATPEPSADTNTNTTTPKL